MTRLEFVNAFNKALAAERRLRVTLPNRMKHEVRTPLTISDEGIEFAGHGRQRVKVDWSEITSVDP